MPGQYFEDSLKEITGVYKDDISRIKKSLCPDTSQEFIKEMCESQIDAMIHTIFRFGYGTGMIDAIKIEAELKTHV